MNFQVFEGKLTAGEVAPLRFGGTPILHLDA